MTQQQNEKYLLAIESSCDDFALAVSDRSGRILFSNIHHQKHSHGVFPEHASRMHALAPWNDLDYIHRHFDIGAIAVTTGPGLYGSLAVGITIAKALTYSLNVPLISVNHIAAHILTPLWCTNIRTPYIILVASGGHTLLALVNAVDNIQILGSTTDDAAGEAFDKTARMLGLQYPGGPEIERAAKSGTPRFALPIPMRNHPGYDFSFSGLKEHIRKKLVTQELDTQTRADWAASIQHGIGNALLVRTRKALKDLNTVRYLSLAGGVASNRTIRSMFDELCAECNASLHCPSPSVCTDNAEMIAWCGLWKWKREQYAHYDILPNVTKARHSVAV